MTKPDPVLALLDTPIPPTLWHYTSLDGFKGIITSKSIHATDIRFLNDKREFIHAREIAEEIARSTPKETDSGFPIRMIIEDAINFSFGSSIYQPDIVQIFVACFSEARDQLSQWRGYSHGTVGVSLGLKLESLRPSPTDNTAVCFAPCVYGADVKRTLIEYVLKSIVDEIESFWKNQIATLTDSELRRMRREEDTLALLSASPQSKSFNQSLSSAIQSANWKLLRIAGLIKDESFHEEREWRLVLPILVKNIPAMKRPPQYRVKPNTLVPYIEQSLGREEDSAVPLDDVIVGPGSHPHARQAISSYLKSVSISIEANESKIPYRQT